MNIARTDGAWPASNALTSWKAQSRTVFWLSFLLLNVPVPPLSPRPGIFNLSPKSHFSRHPVQAMAELFVRRENADIFRLSAELLLLVSLYANVRRLRDRRSVRPSSSPTLSSLSTRSTKA